MTSEPDQNYRLNETVQSMLDLLDARSKDVIVRRFGLKREQKETLESIGREYGITRERVRQIEANAKKTLGGLNDLYEPASDVVFEVFQNHGGVMAEQHIVKAVREHTREDVPANVVIFYLVILPGFVSVPGDSVFDGHWRHEKAIHPAGAAIVETAINFLKEKKHPVPQEEALKTIRRRMDSGDAGSPTDEVIIAALTASKQINATVFGEWGLTSWTETNPRGVGDKAYSVLRRNGKPSHFREITQLINDAGFDHKTANPQTVHNELIKDGRFVLVGRGLYGLKEWGYISGTVADVLEAILKDAAEPLTSDQLISKVMKQRIVKKNTILLSLQNNKRFEKTQSGYTLR